jgi:chlorobactene glucosyltransferase
MAILGWVVLGLALAGLAVVLWNVSRFWPRPQPRPERSGDAALAGQVAVLVPARNEERNIAALLASLLDQGTTLQSITVLDDRSTDRTAEIVREFAAHDSRVRLISGVPLPDNWCGKCWACQQLGQQAQAPWLLFLDADTKLMPGAVAAMLDSAARRGVSFHSCWPGHDLCSAAERFWMPMLNFTVYSMFPAALQLWRPTDPSCGIAHGTCIMVRGGVYHRLGGHRAVQSSLFEDARLAQHFRRNGERTLCVDGQDLIRVRMYTKFAEIWEGFEKNTYPACGTQLRFASFMALRGLFFQLPLVAAPLLALRGLSSPLLWAAGGAVLLQRLLLALYFRQPLWPVALHPLAEAGVLAVSLSSWWRMTTGVGVTWRGRTYKKLEQPIEEGNSALGELLGEGEGELQPSEQ